MSSLEEKQSRPVEEFVETLTGRGGLVLALLLLAFLFLLLPPTIGGYSTWTKSNLNERGLTLYLPGYSELQAVEGERIRLKLVNIGDDHELFAEGIGIQRVLPGQVNTWEFMTPKAGTLIIECNDPECPYHEDGHAKLTVIPSSLFASFLKSVAAYWSAIPFAIIGLAFAYASRSEGLWKSQATP